MNIHLIQKTPKDIMNFQLALKANVDYLITQSPTVFHFDKYTFNTQDIVVASENVLHDLSIEKDLHQSLAQHFQLIKLKTKHENQPLFTGYYTPIAQANTFKSQKYSVPVYGTPSDLITVNLNDFNIQCKTQKLRGRLENNILVPYWNRKQIREENKLKNKAPILAWVKDRIDLFYIEVQGSGLLVFPDGSKKLLQYDQQNGRPYSSISAYLIKTGELTKETVSMHNIRNWLAHNPQRVDEVLNYNESFVFFKLEEAGAPFGNTGVKLLPQVDFAADQSFYPAGTLMLVDMPMPENNSIPFQTKQQATRFTQVGMIQDSGGAIKGSKRIDIYWGVGEQAGEIAGNINQRGDLYILIPMSATIKDIS